MCVLLMCPVRIVKGCTEHLYNPIEDSEFVIIGFTLPWDDSPLLAHSLIEGSALMSSGHGGFG